MKVFLSYNSKNRAFVEVVAANLKRDGFDLFFDKESIIAGDDWSKAIGEGLKQSTAALIFIGEEGIGPWQEKEVLTVASKQTSSPAVPYRIIPVILPSINSKTAHTPDWVLVNYQWVQYANPSDQHAYARIVEGLRASFDKAGSCQRGKNPYKGLQSFQVEDSSRFFGRTYELNQVFHDKLRFHVSIKGHNFLAVVAESGSGKSSFLQAGILAALKKGQFQGSEQWRQITLKPGSDPLMELSTTLTKEGLVKDSLAFEERALGDPDALLREIKEHEDQNTWVIYVDQFEEVLTQHPKKEQAEKRRAAFLANLTQVVESEQAVVLISLRSDYYTHFGAYPGFKSLLESHNYTLPSIRMEEEDEWKNNQILKNIISKPALNAGVFVDSNLENQLINALRGVHGKLPILQFTLDMLWKQIAPDARQITLTDFAHISKNQDLSGIIKTHADQVVNDLTRDKTDAHKVDLIRRIFVPHLVEISEGREDVRRTARKEDLLKMNGFVAHEVESMLSELSGEKNRIITVDGNNVNVMHEVIIREWPLLKVWIDSRREEISYRDKLLDKAIEFEKDNESPISLIQLPKAEEWQINNPDLTNNIINDLIKKSKEWHIIDARREEFAYRDKLRNMAVEFEKGNGPILNQNQLYKAKNWRSNNPDLADERIYNFISKSDISINEQNKFLIMALIALIIGITYLGTDPIGLEKLSGLQSLTVSNDSLSSLSGLEKLRGLQSLTVSYNDSLSSLSGLEKLRGLQSLTVSYNDPLNSLSGLEKLDSLKSLTVSYNSSLSSLSGLEKLSGLQSLTVSYNSSLRSLSGLEKLDSLKSLTVSGNYFLSSLSGLEKLSGLQSLTLGETEFRLLKDQIYVFKNLEKLNVPRNVSVNYDKLSENNPGVKLIRSESISNL